MLLDQGSRVYQAFLDMERAAFLDGALPTVAARFALTVMEAVFADCPKD